MVVAILGNKNTALSKQLTPEFFPRRELAFLEGYHLINFWVRIWHMREWVLSEDLGESS